MTSDVPWVRRRTRRHVDHRMQSTLIVALVVVQLLLIALCVWQLDVQLHAALDAEIYRVHFDGPPDADAFRDRALRVLLAFVAANLALVLLIELAWRAYLQMLLTRFRGLLQKVRERDFSSDTAVGPPHPLLALALRWHRLERQRLLLLRHLGAELSAAQGDPVREREWMREVARALPQDRPAPDDVQSA